MTAKPSSKQIIYNPRIRGTEYILLFSFILHFDRTAIASPPHPRDMRWNNLYGFESLFLPKRKKHTRGVTTHPSRRERAGAAARSIRS